MTSTRRHPPISHAILTYNRGRTAGLADGIVITPSHNPPDSGGFKYNPPDGGPADTQVTAWMESRANELMQSGLSGVNRVGFAQARHAATTHSHDYLNSYVADLGKVIDMDAHPRFAAFAWASIRWAAPACTIGRASPSATSSICSVVNDAVDPTFRFMTLDWDGKIRMDPSSPYAMQRLIALKDKYDIAFACDTDHDRHGIVTASGGLMPPNHYLSVAGRLSVSASAAVETGRRRR